MVLLLLLLLLSLRPSPTQAKQSSLKRRILSDKAYGWKEQIKVSILLNFSEVGEEFVRNACSA